MMNLKTTIALSIFVLFSGAHAQTKDNQEIIANFEIYDARFNDTDITPKTIEKDAYLAIYKDNNNLMFSNFWIKSDSQSYGQIYSIVKELLPETETDHKGIIYHFYWSYNNTYDSDKGTAKMKLLLLYKPKGVFFQLEMETETLNSYVYRGTVTGDLESLEF